MKVRNHTIPTIERVALVSPETRLRHIGIFNGRFPSEKLSAVRILQQNVKRRMNEQMKFEVIKDPVPPDQPAHCHRSGQHSHLSEHGLSNRLIALFRVRFQRFNFRSNACSTDYSHEGMHAKDKRMIVKCLRPVLNRI